MDQRSILIELLSMCQLTKYNFMYNGDIKSFYKGDVVDFMFNYFFLSTCQDSYRCDIYQPNYDIHSNSNRRVLCSVNAKPSLILNYRDYS